LNEIKFDTKWSGELRAEKIRDQGNSTSIKIFLPTWSTDVLDRLVAGKAQKTEEYRSTVAKILGVETEDVIEVAPFQAGFAGDIIQLRPSVDLASLRPDAKAFVRGDRHTSHFCSSQVPFSPQMTIVTQVDEAASGPGKLAIKSRVHCDDFGIGEDPVVSPPTQRQS
jgi:predicted PhzF superfamily epimerase YddE/YHI9